MVGKGRGVRAFTQVNTTNREGSRYVTGMLNLLGSLLSSRSADALNDISAALVWRPVLALEHLKHSDFLIRQRVSRDGLHADTRNRWAQLLRAVEGLWAVIGHSLRPSCTGCFPFPIPKPGNTVD